MHYKAQNYETALEGYEQAIQTYGKTKNEEIMEQVFWARYQTGKINAIKGNENKAINIFAELKGMSGHKGKLWKKLASEHHRTISNKLSYDDYLKK